jgi:hypothetical protein
MKPKVESFHELENPEHRGVREAFRDPYGEGWGYQPITKRTTTSRWEHCGGFGVSARAFRVCRRRVVLSAGEGTPPGLGRRGGHLWPGSLIPFIYY